MTSSSVLKLSGEFEPTTLQEAGGFVRLLDDDGFNFFLKLFHCIMPHVDIFLSQLQKRAIDSVSHVAIHTVFLMSAYIISYRQ